MSSVFLTLIHTLSCVTLNLALINITAAHLNSLCSHPISSKTRGRLIVNSTTSVPMISLSKYNDVPDRNYVLMEHISNRECESGPLGPSPMGLKDLISEVKSLSCMANPRFWPSSVRPDPTSTFFFFFVNSSGEKCKEKLKEGKMESKSPLLVYLKNPSYSWMDEAAFQTHWSIGKWKCSLDEGEFIPLWNGGFINSSSIF